MMCLRHDAEAGLVSGPKRLLARALMAGGVLMFGVIAQAAPLDDTPPAARDSADKSGTVAARASKEKSDAADLLAPAQERAVREFVQEHQPQLARVLDHLESRRPVEYQRALRDLQRHRQRIVQFRERDPRRHELELKLWRLQSRGQLLAAQMRMAGEPSLEAELREVLDQQVATRLEILEHERERLAKRSNRVQQQIRQLERRREQMIERQLNAMLRKPRPAARQAQDDAAGAAQRQPSPPADASSPADADEQ